MSSKHNAWVIFQVKCLAGVTGAFSSLKYHKEHDRKSRFYMMFRGSQQKLGSQLLYTVQKGVGLVSEVGGAQYIHCSKK